MQTAIVFLFIFITIVCIHEFGHFIVAKWAGVMVREFSIGMGPKIIQKKWGETIYTLRLLPLGGYVQLAGDEESEELLVRGQHVFLEYGPHPDDATKQWVTSVALSEDTEVAREPFVVHSFDLEYDLTLTGVTPGELEEKTVLLKRTFELIDENGSIQLNAPAERQMDAISPWKRFLVHAAGPISNFILSFIVFIMIAFMGNVVTMNTPEVGAVLPNSPAEMAGLQAGDAIQTINGKSVQTWYDMVEQIQVNKDEKVEVAIKRGKKEMNVFLTPKKEVINEKESMYYIGIKPQLDQSLSGKLKFGWNQSIFIVKGMGQVFKGFLSKGVKVDDFGGPVAMFAMTKEVSGYGLLSILNFMAVISINLGVMNLLPIPALDGGRMVIDAIEGIMGRSLPKEKVYYVTMVSVILLIGLMVLITWNDIMRYL
ncbi:RIP metalloprotease RseP [Atopobacter phocae]|uniref:RIP metalloprotease RseP n=1 Tax=Atopobacter phocae TaxID=136492 RepID=UPI0004729BC8|nr:RIP metalloprotease RseP [Atopobacter phocae]